MKCKYCNNDDKFEYKPVGPHWGQYCLVCGKFVKWLNKQEKKEHGINCSISSVINIQNTKDEIATMNKLENLDKEVPW